MMIESGPLFTIGEMFTITLILETGFCFYMTSFISDIEQCLQDMNEDFLVKGSKTQTVKEKAHQMNKFFNVMRFYIEARRLSNV